MAVDAHDRDELAPLARTMSITGLGKSTIYRGMREGWFPKPVKVRRKTLWPVSRLHTWVAQQVASSEQVGTK
ncbi:AlpA family transcriptional regulator [Xanthomonas oryzae]|uniref:helix-turn-helix transcriptional regulator n=1 Tax=Xanthomonas oryzae TaxID=347 RepID=UPI0018F19251|nr:AlpA family phage regulatory protein [Xanthomonas oryzae]